MSFPYIFHSNFAAGTAAEWDSSTGAGLSFPHFSTLAGIPNTPAPYSGAYCMMVSLVPGTTSDQTVTEGDIDIATGVTRYFRWMMYISSDFAATADDNFSIFELQQAGGTQEFVVGCTITAATGALALWVAIDTTPETTSTINLPKGRWFTVEVIANVDTAAANGDISVNVEGSQYVSLATPVQNAGAVGKGVLGTQNTLSTTTGRLLFADFIMDDAQLYPPNERFPLVQRLQKTGHVFVGPGCIESATILSANGTMDVYDTDVSNTNDAQAKKIQLDTSGNFVSHSGITRFERGCYVVLGGTNPQGEVRLSTKSGNEGGPTAHFSDGAIRTYGSRRLPRGANV